MMFDLIVVGAGSGGLAASRKAASYGKKVAVIEKYRPGGTCVIRGCVPKKMTYNLANLYDNVHHHFKRYGISVANPSFDYALFKEHRDKYIDKLENIYRNNLKKDGVELIMGTAHFDKDAFNQGIFSVDVTTSNGLQKIQGKQLIIACGLKPNWPKIPGSEFGITSDEFFLLNYMPTKVVVVGAGYIAIELAGAMRSLGADVTLVVRSKVLRTFDDMIRTEVAHNMTRDGIKIVYGSVSKVVGKSKERNWNHGRDLAVTINDQVVDNVDEILFAIGRIPDTERLGLSNLNVELLDNGFIKTTEYQETNIPNLFAIGDITGKHELTPVAIKAGRTLGDRLFGGKNTKVDHNFVPSVFYHSFRSFLVTHPLEQLDILKKKQNQNLKILKCTRVDLLISLIVLITIYLLRKRWGTKGTWRSKKQSTK